MTRKKSKSSEGEMKIGIDSVEIDTKYFGFFFGWMAWSFRHWAIGVEASWHKDTGIYIVVSLLPITFDLSIRLWSSGKILPAEILPIEEPLCAQMESELP